MSEQPIDPAELPVNDPTDEPVATTSYTEDHSDPWAFAGDVADAPEDCGTAPTTEVV